MHFPRIIVITGASSGLGAALAKAYARPGVTLGLLGRDAARLEGIAEACILQGAHAECGIVDVRDAAAMREWLCAFDDMHPVELLIANAGISAGTAGGAEDAQQVRDIFAVNLDGALNTVLPLIPRMQQRKSGQIAFISSLAGIRGLPGCPSYSASKAAVRTLGEGLRGALKPGGIGICVVCPGYVHTPMTQVNSFPMPFIMSAEKAAAIIQRGIGKNRPRIAFPLALYLPLWLLSFLPQRLTDPFFAALPKKIARENT